MPQGVTLVTGAGGFIGRRVTGVLRESGKPTLALSRRSGFDLAADLSDPTQVESLDLGGISTVVHCAALTPSAATGSDPAEYLRHNVAATLTLLNALDPERVSAFVLLSSVAVYDGIASLREDARCWPRDPYGSSKLLQEQAVLAWAPPGCRVVILRPSSVYGPGQARTVVPIFLERARRNLPLEVTGPRSYRQNFVFVEDLAAIVGAACGQGQTGRFNVFSDDTVDMAALAAAVREATGAAVPIEDRRVDESPPLPERRYDNARLKQHFDVPLTSLSRGLAVTAAG